MASIWASRTGPSRPMPTAWLIGDPTPANTAQPPAISNVTEPGRLAKPRALIASANSIRRARAKSAKVITSPGGLVSSYRYGDGNGSASSAGNDLRELRAQRGAQARGHAGREQGNSRSRR